jgi:hypothetical protein
MIKLSLSRLTTVDDAKVQLQTAIGVEFGTLPPYLYALYSLKPDANSKAANHIRSVVLQEMIHMCLACNILNALGGDPVLTPQAYPGPLPGDIGPDGTPLSLHLLPFSKDAMAQAMAIEEPVTPMDIPVATLMDAVLAPTAVTIGQFYARLDAFLSTLPATAWSAGRRQIDDSQFFPGQLFAINSYNDASKAIREIVSEGEGAKDDPLDFQHEVAHFYRFGEVFHEKVLTKANTPVGYAWGPAAFPVDWSAVYPAIADPGAHGFSSDPAAAKAAQADCNAAFTALVTALQRAVAGQSALGEAVQAMFKLRRAAAHAFTVPLADGAHTAGPAFLYQPVH